MGVTKEGKGHGLFRKHRWINLDPKDKDEYDKRELEWFCAVGDYHAQWTDLYICECGAECIRKEFGLI